MAVYENFQNKISRVTFFPEKVTFFPIKKDGIFPSRFHEMFFAQRKQARSCSGLRGTSIGLNFTAWTSEGFQQRHA